MPSHKLHLIPLGGLGEFGMNCLAVRWGDDIIVIDAGLMFPESELLGVDIVVPDITYLIQNREKVRGIVLTHGHEDHIGAIPYLWPQLQCPIWATPFTASLLRAKLVEARLLEKVRINTVPMSGAERFQNRLCRREAPWRIPGPDVRCGGVSE